MKIYFVALCLIWTVLSFGQTNKDLQKGNYFQTTSTDYFERVIKPWKYQYVQTQIDEVGDSVNKVGQIIFWRSKAVYDYVAKKYWKPYITYDVYFVSDSIYVSSLAYKTKSLASCDSINRGGDVLFLGHFIMVNPSVCVHCSSSSNVDHCRNIIRRILEAVSDKDADDWNAILKQFIIDKANFKS